MLSVLCRSGIKLCADGGKDMEENKKKFKIPWGLIFNITIIGLTFFLILYFVFSEGGFVDLLNSGLEIHLVWLIAAVFVHLLNIALDTTVIYLFIKESQPELMTVKKAIIASLTGQFFCAVTPSASGGQPMQVLALSRMGIRPSVSTSALIQKFLVWQFTMSVYCIVAVAARFSFFAEHLDTPMWILSVLGFSAQIVMIVILLLASFCKPLTIKVVNGFISLLGKLHLVKKADEKKKSMEETLDSFHKSNKELNKNKLLLVKVYVITAVQMTAYFLVPFCIAQSFGINCNMFDMLCAQSYVSMVSSLVPLPGGSGAAEYCFQVFFGTYFTDITIKSAILLWRTITYYGTIALTAPFAWLRKKQSFEEKQDPDNVLSEITDI